MCLNQGARMLATAAALAAFAAPATHAQAIEGGGGVGLPLAEHHIVQAPRPSSSPDWELIAIAGGGTVIVACAGLGGSRRLALRRTAVAPARAPHTV